MNALVVSCEHGGKRVPQRWKPLFEGQDEVLASHRGYDPGALALARLLASRIGAPLVSSNVTRLLVDLNRSASHPRHFSEWTRPLPKEERERIDRQYFSPYRAEVERRVREATARCGWCVHVSVHSFTPVFEGEVREADVGLLYDPSRVDEVELVSLWRDAIRHRAPDLRVRRNYPYKGCADGLTTALRRVFSSQRYVGIELEINQRYMLEEPRSVRERAERAVVGALAEIVGVSVD